MGISKVTLIGTNGAIVKAQFNPSQVSLSRSVNWNPQAGADQESKPVQHTHSEPKNLSFELLFDTFEENRSCAGKINALLSFTERFGDDHAPPQVLVMWGGLTFAGQVFKGVFQNLSVTYTMFLADGSPCRAKANCQMIEYIPMDEQQAKNKNQSPDHAKMRVVRRGDTLHTIAAAEYDDPREWRRIADVNNINDPINLEPGMELLVPPILIR